MYVVQSKKCVDILMKIRNTEKSHFMKRLKKIYRLNKAMIHMQSLLKKKEKYLFKSAYEKLLESHINKLGDGLIDLNKTLKNNKLNPYSFFGWPLAVYGTGSYILYTFEGMKSSISTSVSPYVSLFLCAVLIFVILLSSHMNLQKQTKDKKLRLKNKITSLKEKLYSYQIQDEGHISSSPKRVVIDEGNDELNLDCTEKIKEPTGKRKNV